MSEDCTECRFRVQYMNKPMCDITKGYLYFDSREANACPLVEADADMEELLYENESLARSVCEAAELIRRIKERDKA